MARDRTSSPQQPGERAPAGCAAREPRALARCTAELRGGCCLLCRRDGEVPPAAPWNAAPGWNIAGTLTVQAVHLERAPDAWVVVTFASGRMVHAAFPPICCTSKARAIELAHARARQIAGRKKVEPYGRDPNAWECGHVHIVIADQFA